MTQVPSNPAQALRAARGADPATHAWGLYMSPEEGGGEGLLWFESSRALQAFVTRDLWPALCGVAPDPDTAVELAELLDGSATLTLDRLEQVDVLLGPVAQVHWWGTLAQLYEGEDPFAKDLREAWRQSAGRGPQDFSALSPQDAQAFADFIRTVFASD